MNPREHLMKAREEMEELHRIEIGSGTVVYDAGARVWALPGGLHTTHRPTAERAAKMIDMMISGQIKGPKVISEEGSFIA